jgi:GNAT superfamily N-acetyltransferase
MEIRTATHLDAEEGSLVLRRSIEELCHQDHGGDPAIIAGWIGNKTAAMWRAWVDQEATELYVATEAGRVLAVGMMDTKGEIMLNYVSPDARLRGISKALLGHMEGEARRLGVNECSLHSTKTARRFYQSAGYRCREDGSGDGDSMIKSLVS